MRQPGGYARAPVGLSLERCESVDDFGETYHRQFLSTYSEFRHLFSGNDLNRQNQALRDSVHKLVIIDLSGPALRHELGRLRRNHGRGGRNIPPRLYELWLDSVCVTVKALDSEWTEALERAWRVRLRTGIQVIMAGY